MNKKTYESPRIGVISCAPYGAITVVQGSGQQGATDTGGGTGGDGIYAKHRFGEVEDASQENTYAPYSLDRRSLWDD